MPLHPTSGSFRTNTTLDMMPKPNHPSKLPHDIQHRLGPHWFIQGRANSPAGQPAPPSTPVQQQPERQAPARIQAWTYSLPRDIGFSFSGSANPLEGSDLHWHQFIPWTGLPRQCTVSLGVGLPWPDGASAFTVLLEGPSPPPWHSFPWFPWNPWDTPPFPTTEQKCPPPLHHRVTEDAESLPH